MAADEIRQIILLRTGGREPHEIGSWPKLERDALIGQLKGEDGLSIRQIFYRHTIGGTSVKITFVVTQEGTANYYISAGFILAGRSFIYYDRSHKVISK